MKKYYTEIVGNHLELHNLMGGVVKSFTIQGMPNDPSASPENLDERVKEYLSIVGGVLQSKPEPKTGVIDKGYLLEKIKEEDLAPEVAHVRSSIQMGQVDKNKIELVLDSLQFYRTLIEEIISRTEDIIF